MLGFKTVALPNLKRRKREGERTRLYLVGEKKEEKREGGRLQSFVGGKRVR